MEAPSGCCSNKNGGCGPYSKHTRNTEARVPEEEDAPAPAKLTEFAGRRLYAVDFPLGGFGAGNVNLAGDGSLQHWSILNQWQQFPNWRDNPMQASWFGIQVTEVDSNSHSEASDNFAAVLRTRTNSTNSFAEGTLPAIQSLSMTGQYPIADIKYDLTLSDKSQSQCKVDLSMEALSPLIPGDVKHSSLPCAIFTFTVHNPTDKAQQVRLLHSQNNFIGWNGIQKMDPESMPCWGGNVNTPFDRGIVLSCNKQNPEDPAFGTLCLTAITDNTDLQAFPSVSVLVEASDEETLWKQFIQGQDVPAKEAQPSNPSSDGRTTCCGLVQNITLAPNSPPTTLAFILTWHFQNRTRSQSLCGRGDWDALLPELLGNYYSTHWFPTNAREPAQYVADHFGHLTTTTRLYRDTLYATTIPLELLECAAGRVSTLRSPTMWYTAEGIVLGSEGNGCCPLNCTHVYGYTTLMERLFPTLAQDMRISDFVRTYDPPGHASFGSYCGGVPMRYGAGQWAMDGAFACIIKTYLVVQQSDPALEFLKKVWPNVKDQLMRIQTSFDTQGDGVIRSWQQNTYDSAMAGANTFIGSYYITALKAVSKMATLMGECELAKSCWERALLAARSYEEICWNESFGYFVADVNEYDDANSYSIGCAVDQLCAVGLSSACGLGHVFDPQREAQARKQILKHNKVTKPPFQDFQNHLYDGDSGLRLCSYPHGKIGGDWKYTNLVGSGFTSPVIAGMLLDGNVSGAREVASLIRHRQDGRNASPWNEPECNTLYARAMAHWNVFDQACGFRYSSFAEGETEIDSPATAAGGLLSFNPRFNVSNFRCFVTLCGGWGEYKQQGVEIRSNDCLGTEVASLPRGLSSGKCSLTCLYGSFAIASLGVQTTAKVVEAKLDGKPVDVLSFDSGVAKFQGVVEIAKGSCLSLVFSTTEAEDQPGTTKCTSQVGCGCTQKQLVQEKLSPRSRWWWVIVCVLLSIILANFPLVLQLPQWKQLSQLLAKSFRWQQHSLQSNGRDLQA